MVGGASDNSAIYYNPGSLAFISNPSLSIDANVYRMDKTVITDGAGGFDIYHFCLGSSYHKQKHTVTVGFSYAITPSEQIPPYTIINQTPELTEKALLSARSYPIILGYTYYFARAE